MMKKFTILLFALVGLTALVGCKKDEPTNNLIGRWQLVSYDLYLDGEYFETSQPTKDTFITITENTFSDGDVTGEYVVEGNNLHFSTGDYSEIMEILENTSDKLRLKVLGEGYYMIMTFKKV